MFPDDYFIDGSARNGSFIVRLFSNIVLNSKDRFVEDHVIDEPTTNQ
jgi:hypothetical protein